MSRLVVPLALGLATAGALADDATPLLTQDQLDTLTAIDTVPSRPQLDFALTDPSATPLQKLRELTSSDDTDPGVRLRAVHALAKYCGDSSTSTPCTAADPAHQSVAALIVETTPAMTGTNVLLLRAAVETIGPMRVSSDISFLVPLLNHGSRDIRASTARALQDLCNTQAITPLRTRYALESDMATGSEQVKLAISEALRILAQCSGSQ